MQGTSWRFSIRSASDDHHSGIHRQGQHRLFYLLLWNIGLFGILKATGNRLAVLISRVSPVSQHCSPHHDVRLLGPNQKKNKNLERWSRVNESNECTTGGRFLKCDDIPLSVRLKLQGGILLFNVFQSVVSYIFACMLKKRFRNLSCCQMDAVVVVQE